MTPSSTSMQAFDSQDSNSCETPLYDTEPPPLYPSQRSPPREDETPLMVHQKRQPKADGPMTVDDFAHQMGRVSYDVNTLRDVVEGIETLKGDISARESPSSTLEALARRTTSASLLLSTSITSLRTLATTLPYLKPAAGTFVVSNSQTLELKQRLAQTAQTLKAVRDKVKAMEQLEEGTEKKDTRMRLLKFIKAKEGEHASQSELMASLLGAERDGMRDAETLEVGSYAWRWAVERPGSRLARTISSTGDTTFLNELEGSNAPAPSLWANTWAYLPSLYSDKSVDRKVSGYSAAGTKESMPVDAREDEETGNYGEPLEERSMGRPSRYKLWAYVGVLLLILGASGVGVGLWVKKLNHATSSGELGEGALSTFVNHMPAHPTA